MLPGHRDPGTCGSGKSALAGASSDASNGGAATATGVEGSAWPEGNGNEGWHIMYQT